MDRIISTYQHYTIPMYDHLAKDEDDNLINGSSIWLFCDDIMEISLTINSTMMEIMYISSENYREVNILMLSGGSKIPKGYKYYKSVEAFSTVYYLFVKIYKTDDEEKVDFREERLDKLLKK